ncbi:MAG TPA: hypothetical protein VK403_12315 [Allosphingosinicella sp.]|nr:hypothetical protein [Allosphingosinicella sp.]
MGGACGSEAESIRAEVIARRASSHQALLDRIQRAKAEGGFPGHIEAEGLADYLGAILQAWRCRPAAERRASSSRPWSKPASPCGPANAGRYK